MGWQIRLGPPRLRSKIRLYTHRLCDAHKDSADRLQAHRKALLDIMTSFIPFERVQFNKRLTNIDQRPDGVTLTFSDGTTAEAAILAGADGIKSTVREHVLKDLYPNQVAPVYAGAYCYRAVIPMSEAYEILGDLTDVAKFYFGPKRSAVTYRITGGEVSTRDLLSPSMETEVLTYLPPDRNSTSCSVSPMATTRGN